MKLTEFTARNKHIPVYTYHAPAKLNLDLRIIGRRADGYHMLESIFVLIDLHDMISLAKRSDGQIRLHTPTDGITMEKDLAFQAAKLLQSYTHSQQGVDIWIDKHIPTGAGLGGGSSDAATVLIALNYLWKCQLSRQILMKLGEQLGADVPFFIFGESAFVQGIGEQMTVLTVPEKWYVVVKPTSHVCTASIFSHKDLTRNSESKIITDFQTATGLRNDMQSVVLSEYPEIKHIFTYLQQYGEPRMTGSGSCLFLSFDTQRDAQVVYQEVSHAHQAYCVVGLNQHPLLSLVT